MGLGRYRSEGPQLFPKVGRRGPVRKKAGKRVGRRRRAQKGRGGASTRILRTLGRLGGRAGSIWL